MNTGLESVDNSKHVKTGIEQIRRSFTDRVGEISILVRICRFSIHDFLYSIIVQSNLDSLINA